MNRGGIALSIAGLALALGVYWSRPKEVWIPDPDNPFAPQGLAPSRDGNEERKYPTPAGNSLGSAPELLTALRESDGTLYALTTADAVLIAMSTSGGGGSRLLYRLPEHSNCYGSDFAVVGHVVYLSVHCVNHEGDSLYVVEDDGKVDGFIGERPPVRSLELGMEASKLVAFGGALYWTRRARVYRLPLQEGGVQQPLVETHKDSSGKPYFSTDLAVDEEHVYWAEKTQYDGPSRIMRVPVAGGAPQVVRADIPDESGLVLHGGDVYFGSGAFIRAVPKAGGEPRDVLLARDKLKGFAVDAGGVYYVTDSGTPRENLAALQYRRFSGGEAALLSRHKFGAFVALSKDQVFYNAWLDLFALPKPE